MRTIRELSPQQTIEVINRHIANGRLIHGSTVLDLDTLEARTPTGMAVDNRTGEPRTPIKGVYLNRDLGKTIMLSFRKWAELNEVHRATGTDGVRNESDVITNYNYFTSGRMKQEAMQDTQEEATALRGLILAMYIVDLKNPEDYRHDDEDEWIVPRNIMYPELVGSLAINFECFNEATDGDNFENLIAPDSVSRFRAYFDNAGIPEETPVRD
jgi:hypothetical protein